jgi:2-polyprenyl-3-methyl-5-hydroxy-6-metoxy-1,4-benzoquinol methylase
MKDLREFYEKWSNTQDGDQSKWLDKNSSHYERFMSYLQMSKPYINVNSMVLDIGCGEGNLLSILPECKKYGIDIASRYVEISKKKNPNFSFWSYNGTEAAISSITIASSGGTFSAGTYTLYGVK